MKDLDFIKKQWQENPEDHPKVSKTDILSMLHKKSFNNVKVLFYIGMAELIFWMFLNFFPVLFNTNTPSNDSSVYLEENNTLQFLSYIGIAITVLFVVLIFKSYKAISLHSNTKKLMLSILHTRKTVQYYVFFNLLLFFVMAVISIVQLAKQPEVIGNYPSEFSFYLFVGGILGGFLLLFWFVYLLLYGFLLRSLKNNFKELKKLEV